MSDFSPIGSSPNLTLDDALAMASKYILVTNATGKQGGAVIDALAKNPAFTLLAQTRNTTSASAQKVAAKGANIKLIEGTLDDIPALFKTAQDASNGNGIWGVYSVQISVGKNVTHEGEIRQGKAMVDEAVKAGVKHFVYSSVERGGDEKSWENPTPVEHFESKHQIEQHLKGNAGQMGWTILRPGKSPRTSFCVISVIFSECWLRCDRLVAFMDNLAPGFPTRVFLAALRDTLGPAKPLQWIAVKDIGVFASKAFLSPQEYNHRAIGLAGDELTVDQLAEVFEKETGGKLEGTWWALGATLKYMVADMGKMVDWFGAEGYGADVQARRKEYEGLMDLGTWIREESSFPKVGA